VQNKSHEWDYLRRVLSEIVCELWIVTNKVGNVNVTVVLLQEHVLSYLVSAAYQNRAHRLCKHFSAVPVDEDIIKRKLHYKIHQRLLHA